MTFCGTVLTPTAALAQTRTPSNALPGLPDDAGILKQMVAELLATVTQLRTTIEKQQAHIQYLVRLTFGRRTERVEGPTLFDLMLSPSKNRHPLPKFLLFKWSGSAGPRSASALR
jgi:hypothetical protein